MLRATLRWSLILLCLFAIGPLVRVAARCVLDADGGHAVTLAVNATAGAAVVAGLVAVLAAGIVGALGAHFFSMGTGYTCAGITLAWARWGLGTFDELVRRSPAATFRPLVAVENGVMLLLAGVMAGLIVWLASRRQPSSGKGGGAHSDGLLSLAVRGEEYQVKAGAAAWCIGMVAGAGVTWLIAFSDLRGQTLMAVLCGAIACGAVGQLIASSMRCTITPVVPALAAVLVAVGGPIIAGFMHNAGLLDAANRGVLLGLARPVSLDWAAGVLLGGPIGISWAGAMLDARAEED